MVYRIPIKTAAAIIPDTCPTVSSESAMILAGLLLTATLNPFNSENVRQPHAAALSSYTIPPLAEAGWGFNMACLARRHCL
jgi:hypothetical protein